MSLLTSVNFESWGCLYMTFGFDFAYKTHVGSRPTDKKLVNEIEVKIPKELDLIFRNKKQYMLKAESMVGGLPPQLISLTDFRANPLRKAMSRHLLENLYEFGLNLPLDQTPKKGGIQQRSGYSSLWV